MRAESVQQGRSRLKNIALDHSIISVIREALNDEGLREFNDQLLEALAKAKETDDVTPINDVIEAWYRTLLFVAKDDEFAAAHDTAYDPKRKPRPREVSDLLKRQRPPEA